MTKKIIKRPLKPLLKKLREPITLEPIPMPPAIEALVLFPNLLEDYQKKSLSVALKNVNHQAFESLEKLCLLSEHYGLHKDDSDRWFFLAFYLARDYHPVFKTQIKANAGRKKAWSEELFLQLYVEVQDKLIPEKEKKQRISLKRMFDELAKEKQWKPYIGHSKDAGKVLHDNYLKAKKSLTVIFYVALINATDKMSHEQRAVTFNSLSRIIKIFP